MGLLRSLGSHGNCVSGATLIVLAAFFDVRDGVRER
jgi:hypothetical protein